MLPAVTNLLIKFESYDAPATQFQMETLRLYFGKILNALVLMYTGANSYVGGSQLELPGVSEFWEDAQSGDACVYGLNSDATYATKATDATSGWPCPVSAACCTALLRSTDVMHAHLADASVIDNLATDEATLPHALVQ